MELPKRYLITAALPYANGLKHIGHLAGAYLPADIYVRYLKAQLRDVAFVCGSDEHGTAIPIQAMKENTTPRAIIEKYHPILERNFIDLGIEFDVYHRTSSEIHHETAKEFFNHLDKNDKFIIKETEQYYDEEAKTFLADRYIKGTCPNCANPEAFGDQCEKCGSSLSPEILINPISTLSGGKPIKKLTYHWYLPLQNYETFLRNWILGEHNNDWRASVLGQCKSWLDGQLQPRAITRDLDWGIAVPDEAYVKAGKQKVAQKVLYVWFDAPIGYISATKQWAADKGKDWQPYWQDKDTKLVHFVGKDNIVFHCIIFPSMLLSRGYILPNNVPANEFMNLEGDKMSTSRGWSIEMEDYINEWVKTDNGGGKMVDALRYYLTSIAPESKDSEFTWKGFQDANNSEIVGIFGNFINRTFVLMHKLCQGKVPPLNNKALDDKDLALVQQISQTKIEVENLIEQYKFREALYNIIDLSRKGNRYLQEKAPWIEAKKLENGGEEAIIALQKIDSCIHLSLQLTANLAILISPFLPFTSKEMLVMMKVTNKMLEWKNAGRIDLLKVGYSLRQPTLLFRKIEDEEITYQINKLQNKMNEKSLANTEEQIKPQGDVTKEESNILKEQIPVKPIINYDDFAKLDIRIGKILTAEKVEKTDKLLKLSIDLGFETRVIVSGIALHFNPQDIVGKQVTVVVNLAPKKMRGIESQGMILMAEDEKGKLHFIGSDVQIDNGSKIS